MENNSTELRISLFFDGTGNNAKNAYEREKEDSKSPKTGGSYDISPTNIYRLFCNLEQKQDAYNKAIYIEGIGTFEGLVDSTLSAATGFDIWNGYDATAKNQKAFEALEKVIGAFNPEGTAGKIILKIDLFGFSRGAALARNFANILESDQSRRGSINKILSKLERSLEGIEFGFIGLFDTVESIIYPPKVQHFNLNLKSIKADCIFQLAALQECRENFPLTSVLGKDNDNNSIILDEQRSRCNIKDNTFEMFVPGAHSDIGGGYNAVQDEIATINLKATYTKKGAQEDVGLITKANPLFIPLLTNVQYEFEAFSGGYNALCRRKNVNGHLQFLYAKLMLVTASKFGVPFDLDTFDSNHAIPKELSPYYDKLIEGSGLLLEGKKFRAMYYEISPELIQKYIHISVSTRSIIGKEEEVIIGPVLKSNAVSRGEIFIVNRPAKDWQRKIIVQ